VDIHKPKPIRNWREFLIEIGTIVIGVTIALAAEQVVEVLHWRHEVGEARSAVGSELAEDIANGLDQIRASSCTQSRLDALTTILDTAEASGRLPPIGDFRQPPLRILQSGVWNSVLASQAAAHFPSEELDTLAVTYGLVAHGDAAMDQQLAVWSDLHQMVGAGRPLSQAEAADLRRALQRARTLDRSLNLIGYRLYQFASSEHLMFSKSNAADIDDALHGRNRPSLDICQPPAPPKSGGEGLLVDTDSMMRDFLKNPPPLRVTGE